MLKKLFKKNQERIFVVYIHIDYNKNYIIVPLKKIFGKPLRNTTQPIKTIELFNLGNIANDYLYALKEIMKNPYIMNENNIETTEIVKRFQSKSFVDSHLLIEIIFDRENKEYYIKNLPKIKNSKGYGQIIKGTISERYSTNYICHTQQEIQEAIEKAYEEGLAYLEAIGEPLKDPKDYKNTNKSNNTNISNGDSDDTTTNKKSNIHSNLKKDIISEVPLYKNTWLVLKNNDNDGFNRLLNDIRNKSKTTYNNALKASREDKIMITGLYDNYYVISSFNLPSSDKPEKVKTLLDKLSNYSSEISYYSSFRTVDLFGFAYMKDKKLLRLYSYCDSILANIGNKLPIEDKLNINLTDNDDNLFMEGYDLLDEDILTNISNGLSLPLEDKLNINLTDNDDHLFKEGYDLLDEDIITSISNGLPLSLEDLLGRQEDNTYVFDIEELVG